MAQRDITLMREEAYSIPKRPSSIQLRTPSSSLQKSTTRRHVTLPEPLHMNYTQSPAERYILSRSQMFCQLNPQQTTPPSTPSTVSSTTKSLISPMGHCERMHIWQQKKMNEMRKKNKHGYVYGPPPSTWGIPFSSPTYFRQSN